MDLAAAVDTDTFQHLPAAQRLAQLEKQLAIELKVSATQFRKSSAGRLARCPVGFAFRLPSWLRCSCLCRVRAFVCPSATVMQVRQGAENMIQMYSSGSSKDKKFLAEAQQMFADAKAKIDYLRMMTMRVKQNQATEAANTANGTCHNNRFDSKLPEITSPLDVRIEELRHRLKVEVAVVEGAKNVVKMLQAAKLSDKKALQEAQANLNEASQKVDVLRKSLEVRRSQSHNCRMSMSRSCYIIITRSR